MQNPDLQSVSSQSATVSALAAITRPMPNTKVTEPVWFFCTMEQASFHRPDGKKLPFMYHLLKCTIKEDIEYLTYQIESHENPYLRFATPEEIGTAKMNENPVQAIKEAVRREVEDTFSIEELQKLIDRRKATVGAVVAGAAAGGNTAGTSAPSKAGPPTLLAQGATSGGGSGLKAATTATLGGAEKTSNSAAK